MELKSGFVDAHDVIRKLENGMKLIGERIRGMESGGKILFLPLLIYKQLSSPEAKMLRSLGGIRFKGGNFPIYWRRYGAEMCEVVKEVGKLRRGGGHGV